MRIVLHANAVHLQADPTARTLRHIVVRPLDGKAREVKARHYVLACGAIENARLLLASNDVEAHGIGNRHDQVGRYFMEHPTGRIGRVHTARPYEMWDAFQKRFMPSGPPLAPVLRLGDATQRATRALNSVATFKLQRPPALGVPLGNRIYQNLKHGIAPDRRGRALDHAYRGVRAWFHREIRGAFERLRARMGKSGLYLIVRGEQAPNPDSRVRLSSERDALGQFRADLDWQLCDADKHSARVFAETFDAELRRLGLGDGTAERVARESRPAVAGGSDRRQSSDRRLPSDGHDAHERRPDGRRGHRRLQRVRLRQSVRRGQLGVRHQRLGQSDAHDRRPVAATWPTISTAGSRLRARRHNEEVTDKRGRLRRLIWMPAAE